MNASRRGIVFGLGAYGLWGLLPLFWALLDDVDAFEVLAHRFVWSLVVVLAVLALTGRLWRLRGSGVRTLGLSALAGTIIAVNWGTFIWGVNNGHVIEVSLGYFINPLVTVLVGVIVLRERLRPLQWLAVAIAAIAVVVLTVDYGRPPWIGLTLAFTFSSYSLIKKKSRVSALESVGTETAALLIPALVFLGVLHARAEATFTNVDLTTDLLLVATGLATATPLLLFAGAASRAPLTTLGLLQYLAPSLTFILGVTVFDEAVPAVRLAGFILVWTALLIFTVEAIQYRRRAVRHVEITDGLKHED
ncbi:EamA family transporter RarD [Actinobacteria bacterium YIM 96077]|uniref:EamA family transporter RarD n=1 Tax=Phytoactinopolyspora halophila TaxID=1981511 RepID=A0A329QL38_9ACTN|nr:EamA family transporter RarD [Phytoactinopolyspora halophila]AYY14780.1 EamA family transporter RarD [Actinobacteria bacterium YIM 96077]RAW13054.1 EamA family transporter RarD [Phytoactinopolyspora halophila]